MLNKIARGAEWLALLPAFLVLILLNYLVWTRSVTVSDNGYLSEKVQVFALSGLCLIFFAFLLGGGVALRHRIRKLNTKRLFIVLSIITVILGLWLIFASSTVLRYDQKYVFQAALHINQGNYSDFESTTGYLNMYPYQLGFVTLERIMITIFGTNAIHAIFVLNLSCVLLINYFMWQITALTTKSEVVTNYEVLMNFLFLPEFFYILFAYGSLPGFTLLTASFYFTIKTWQKKGRYSWLWAAILAILAYQIKSNYLIGIIAIVICCLLNFLKKRHWQSLALIGMCVLLLVGSNQALNQYYSHLTGYRVSVSGGVPKSLFFVMGLSKNHQRSDGWYNAHTVKVYRYYHGNSDKAMVHGEEELIDKVVDGINYPDAAADLFRNKIVTTWDDALFQSLWSGPNPKYHQLVRGWPWRNLYDQRHGKLYHTFYNLCHGFYAIILMSALLGMFYYFIRRRQSELLLLVVYFLGGFAFHLLSETKSQYVFNYVIALIPLAAIGFSQLMVLIDRKIFTKKRIQ